MTAATAYQPTGADVALCQVPTLSRGRGSGNYWVIS